MDILEKGRVYRVDINDYLYLDIVYDGSNVIIDSFGNVPIDNIDIVSSNQRSIIMVTGIPSCFIKLDDGSYRSRLNIVPTAFIRNYSELIKSKGEDSSFQENYKSYIKNSNLTSTTNNTELHTHFMEVLGGEEYLLLVLKYLDSIALDSNKILVDSYPTLSNDPTVLDSSSIGYWVSKKDILTNKNIYNNLVSQLSIPVDKQVSFSEINKILKRRTALLELIGFKMTLNEVPKLVVPDNEFENEVRKLRSDAKADIYVDILIKCLDTLKKQGVKYVEFSYSTPNTIKKIYNKIKDIDFKGIKFNFLLSENRNASGLAFSEYTNSISGEKKRNKKSLEAILPKLIKDGFVTGFDLMGMEQQLVPFDYEKDSIDGISLYDKLTPIIKILNSFNNDDLVCRLHAGEIHYDVPDIEDKSNPERTLEILDKIVNDNNLVVPPPTIRLGHGLHIEKNSNYLNLLKKYKVIIEINASSNFALSNIKNMTDIPYRWYIENGIPMVLGTDGGGFYLTSITDEAKIAEIFGGEDVIKEIHETDQNELRRRGL